MLKLSLPVLITALAASVDAAIPCSKPPFNVTWSPLT